MGTRLKRVHCITIINPLKNERKDTLHRRGTGGLQKLDKARKEYESLRADVMNSDGNDTTDTSPTFKVLEEGASTLSKEEAGRLAQRQAQFIRHLQAALVRIENKTYGIDRITGKLIPKERLRAVPHATLCVDSKLK